MAVPALFFFIFRYLPMVGLIVAFKDYSIRLGFFRSPWVGFQWFEQFFSSYFFPRLVRNTFLIGLYTLVFGFPVPVIFAVLLNEVNNKLFRNVAQSVSYLPYFISLVVVVGMIVNFFAPNEGVVNVVLTKLGREQINFLNDPSWFRPLYVGSEIWQTFGFNAVIYIAAITSIPLQLYEAATIDGAGRFQKMLRITLPSMVPTIVVLLLLNMGRLFNVGFQKIVLMYNPSVYETADVISSYVFRRGFGQADYSFGTAVGLFNSVITFILVVIFNWIARKVSDISLW